MRCISLLVLFALPLVALAEKAPAEAPINPRLIALATSSAIAENERPFLTSLAKDLTPEGCVATALLFRNWPEEYYDSFLKVYGMDANVKITVLSNADINERVNTRMRELQGRHPLEVTSRLYLMMRRSGYVAKRPDGTELSLEVMFRGAVFTGVLNGKIEDVLRFSAIADGKSPPPASKTP